MGLLERLVKLVGQTTAQKWAHQYPAAYIEEKLALVEERRPNNPGALLRAALKEDYRVMKTERPESQGWQLRCYYCRLPIQDVTEAMKGGSPKQVKTVTVIYPRCSACGKTQPWAI